jgi:hypothetical protein
MMNSRYAYSIGKIDNDGITYLTDPEPFPYDNKLPGTIKHVVADGETIWTIARKYYSSIKNAEHLWWVIADFQPVPLHDMTIDLTVGSILYIPSMRVLSEQILGKY